MYSLPALGRDIAVIEELNQLVIHFSPGVSYHPKYLHSLIVYYIIKEMIQMYHKFILNSRCFKIEYGR